MTYKSPPLWLYIPIWILMLGLSGWSLMNEEMIGFWYMFVAFIMFDNR